MNPPAERRGRRLRLTPVRSIPVAFAGERAGEGPLTLGQLNVYLWLNELPEQLYTILRVELPVPGPASVDDVAAAVAVLITRYESLRTTYVPGDPPRQRVAASGVQPVEVCSLGAGRWGPRDRPAVAHALVRWLRESPGPPGHAMRVAVAVDPGAAERVIACAAAFSHVAVDHGAIGILTREFADLVGDPARRQAGPRRHQPLDQAELEATPDERRKAAAALEHVREQSWRMPRCLYALPGARPGGESLAVELSSAAAAMAVRRIAARNRASRSSVVLAAICAVVSRRAGYPELALPLLSSNRFERHLAHYVGSLAQDAKATITVGGRSFDELVRHTWRAVMEACRHGRYDEARRVAMDRLIEDQRGLRFNCDPFFNSLVPESWSGLTAGVGFQPEEIGVALGRTELRWRPMPFSDSPIRFTLSQIDGVARLNMWSGDASLVPRAELESVLLATERLLAAAASGDVAGDRMPGIIKLDPLAGSPGRILVDHCWVDVADVRRLVEDAVGPAVAYVFGSADGRPLVAHVAASAEVSAPEQAHARCMAALDRHPAAITPRHYVICPGAPADPSDPAAWPAPLAAGTGRAV